jgi:hypothetical protein
MPTERRRQRLHWLQPRRLAGYRDRDRARGLRGALGQSRSHPLTSSNSSDPIHEVGQHKMVRINIPHYGTTEQVDVPKVSRKNSVS